MPQDDGGGTIIDGSMTTIDGSTSTVDGSVTANGCDMTGVWVVAQVVPATALGATQTTVNWYYHDITQTGDTFTINKSLDCGFRVTGTTTVTLPDNTMEALAKRSTSVGRKGTFKQNAAGTCDFNLNRAYSVRGVNVQTFLSSVWVQGDPDKDLSTFPPLPANAAAGMEDWDADGKEGITLTTGLGDRYVGQRDWAKHSGTVPKGDMFGGPGVVIVNWDSQEAVSTQTSALLRTQATPVNPGRGWWARVGSALTVVTTGAHPELETCKNVQRLALMKFPNP